MNSLGLFIGGKQVKKNEFFFISQTHKKNTFELIEHHVHCAIAILVDIVSKFNENTCAFCSPIYLVFKRPRRKFESIKNTHTENWRYECAKSAWCMAKRKVFFFWNDPDYVKMSLFSGIFFSSHLFLFFFSLLFFRLHPGLLVSLHSKRCGSVAKNQLENYVRSIKKKPTTLPSKGHRKFASNKIQFLMLREAPKPN